MKIEEVGKLGISSKETEINIKLSINKPKSSTNNLNKSTDLKKLKRAK